MVDQRRTLTEELKALEGKTHAEVSEWVFVNCWAILQGLQAGEENTILRGLLQHNPEWKCPYGHVPVGKQMGHCILGFPGCACADDILCGEDEEFRSLVARHKAVKAFAVRLLMTYEHRPEALAKQIVDSVKE